MQNLVIVSHPTLNNCSIPIVVEKIRVKFGDDVEERERSRPYVFQNFQAEIPFKYVPLLIEQRGKEFKVEGPVPIDESSLTELEKQEYEEFKQQVERFMGKHEKKAEEKSKEQIRRRCPFCDKSYTGSRANTSLTSHIRLSHEDEYEEWKKNK